MKSLIVSDNTSQRRSLASVLAGQGIDTTHAGNLSAGVKALRRDTYPLVFAADRLRGATMAQVPRKLRDTSGGSAARIVALSTADEPDTRAYASAGFDGVLGRNAPPNEILAQIAAIRHAPADSATPATAATPSLAPDPLAPLRDLGRRLLLEASSTDQARAVLQALTTILPDASAAIWQLEDTQAGDDLASASERLTLLAAVDMDDDARSRAEASAVARLASVWDPSRPAVWVIPPAAAPDDDAAAQVEIILHGRAGPLGLIRAFLPPGEVLGDADVAQLDVLGALATLALDLTRARATRTAQPPAATSPPSAAATDDRARREHEAIQEMLRLSFSQQHLNALLRGVFATLTQHLGYTLGGIWTVSPDGSLLVGRASTGADVPSSLPLDQGVVGHVLQTREPIFLSDSADTADLVPSYPDATSEICVPITAGQRLFGVLDVASAAARPLDDRDFDFLRTLATHLAAMIERAELAQHLERQTLTDLVTGLPNRQAFQQALDLAVANARRNRISVLAVSADHFKGVNELYGLSTGDDILRQLGQTLRSRLKPSHFLARYTSDQFLVLLPTVNRDTAVSIAEDLRIAAATHLFTAAEQVEQITVSIGAATFPDDAATAQSLLQAADHAMLLAKRAGRNQTFQSNAAFAMLAPAHGRIGDLLRQSPNETLSLLIHAMDQRMPERAGHAERVTRYALAIGRRLQLGEEDIQHLRLAAFIHDIGMVTLPDSLLRKPTTLSPAERELLRGVPVAAHGLLEQLDLPQFVRLAVLHQRESWDGSGYPDRLSGNDIPLGSRIIAVADAIDAMTSARAHRDPMTLEQALGQVRHQAGAQFDPAVAAAAEDLDELIPSPPRPETGDLPPIAAADDDADAPALERRTG